jgi:hypothetical protein
VERPLRAAALLLAAALLWLSLPRAPRLPDRAVAGGGELPRELRAWTRAPAADTLHADLEGPPPPLARAWLAALRRAGTEVTWSVRRAAPAAMEARTSPDPAGGLTVAVAAPDGESIVLHDDLGPLDSATSREGGVTLAVPGARRKLAALVAGTVLSTAPESLVPRGVAVLGAAGWESHFVVRALEERGWKVDASLAVAPGIEITSGRPLPLDTSRHAAVVVLDSLDAATARAVSAFVRSGGGLVAGPEAGGLPAALAPLGGGEPRRPRALTFAGADPRRALSLTPVRFASRAATLEQLDGAVAAAARRFEAGRVVGVGYDETWRWRLAGGEDAPEAHREWWARAVAAAAYRPPADADPAAGSAALAAASPDSGSPGVVPAHADPAPLAAAHAALGAPLAEAGATSSRADPRRLMPALAALCLAALLGEWASRRMRGAS